MATTIIVPAKLTIVAMKATIGNNGLIQDCTLEFYISFIISYFRKVMITALKASATPFAALSASSH